MYGGEQGGKGDQISPDMLYAAAMLAAAEDQKKKQFKYLEGLLPLILLLVLGFFLALKMGFLGDVAAYLGMTKPVTVLILTDQPDAPEIKATVNVLTSDLARYLNIQPQPLKFKGTDTIYASTLSEYDVVMLYQVDDKTLNVQTREELAKYVERGGKLIIVKDSGTYLPGAQLGMSGTTFVGWYKIGASGDPAKSYVPVTCGVTSCEHAENVAGRIVSYRPEHPIMDGIRRIPPEEDAYLNFPDIVTNVHLAQSGGTIVALIEEVAAQQNATPMSESTYPAIVVRELLPPGGTVVYFNYDPYITPVLLVNTIDWLS